MSRLYIAIRDRHIFTLPMPIATEEQIKEWNETRQHVEDDSVLKDKKVLLCEDHSLNQQITTRILQAKGMKVICAENGEIGLKTFEESQIGVYFV